MIANDQIKKVRGDDASIEVVSLTNLGCISQRRFISIMDTGSAV